MSVIAQILCCALIGQQIAKSDERAVVTAAHDAFVSNRASFDCGEIEFTYIQGNAKNEQAARDGGFEPSYSATGRFVFAGGLARYERIFSEEDIKRTSTRIGNDRVVVLESFRAATNGAWSIYDTPHEPSGVINLSAGTREFDRDFKFPLSLGRVDAVSVENLAQVLMDGLRGTNHTQVYQVVLGVDYEHAKTLKLSLTLMNGSGDYWIDMARGAVPLKIVDRVAPTKTMRGYHSAYYFDDLRHIPGHGWLPFRESWWHDLTSQGGRIEITRASFGARPKRGSFGLEFPKAIPLYSEAQGMRFAPRKVWDVSDLPSDHSLGAEKVQYASLPASDVPKLPGEREPQSSSMLIILGVVALVLSAGLLVWARRNRDA